MEINPKEDYTVIRMVFDKKCLVGAHTRHTLVEKRYVVHGAPNGAVAGRIADAMKHEEEHALGHHQHPERRPCWNK